MNLRLNLVHDSSDLKIHLAENMKGSATIGGRVIPLTELEAKLLKKLADKRGTFVSNGALLTTVWGSRAAKKRGNLKLYILYLRRKLEKDPEHPVLIVNARGIGYMLVSPS